MTTLTRAALLAALTDLAEQTIDEPLLGGAVHIRELTAKQRQQATEAALASDPESPDNALYRAIIVQCGVIDPATRQPLLTAEDVQTLSDGRSEAVQRVAVAILKLSEALPDATFPGNSSPNAGQ